MPLYEYECAECGERTEVIRSVLRSAAHRVPELRRRAEEAPVVSRVPVQGLGLVPDGLREVGRSRGSSRGKVRGEEREREEFFEGGRGEGPKRRSSGAKRAGRSKKEDSSKGKKERRRRADAAARHRRPRRAAPPAPSKKNPNPATRNSSATFARDWARLPRSPLNSLMRSRALSGVLALFGAGARASAASAADAPRGTSGLWYRYPLPGAEVKSLVADPAVPGLYLGGHGAGRDLPVLRLGRLVAEPAGGRRLPGLRGHVPRARPASARQRVGRPHGSREGRASRAFGRRRDGASRSCGAGRTGRRHASSRSAAQGGRRVVAVGGDYGIEISEDDGLTWRSSAPALDAGQRRVVPRVPPDARGRPLLRELPPPLPVDGHRAHVGADRGGHGRGHRSLRDGLRRRLARRVLGRDVRLGVPDDGRRHELDAPEGGTPRPPRARRADGPARRDSRFSAGTTGGIFESRDRGKSFRRLSPELVVNALVFDPRDPARLLVATEAEGILRSEDGGVTLTESNRGLAEARVSAVALRPSGRVVVARAADGRSGGLWEVDAVSGDTSAAGRHAAVHDPRARARGRRPARGDARRRLPAGRGRFPVPEDPLLRHARLRARRSGADARGDGRRRLRVAGRGPDVGPPRGAEVARRGRAARAPRRRAASRPGPPTPRASRSGGTAATGCGARCRAEAGRSRAGSGARAFCRASRRSRSGSSSTRRSRSSSSGPTTSPTAASRSRCRRRGCRVAGWAGDPRTRRGPLPRDDGPRALPVRARSAGGRPGRLGRHGRRRRCALIDRADQAVPAAFVELWRIASTSDACATRAATHAASNRVPFWASRKAKAASGVQVLL